MNSSEEEVIKFIPVFYVEIKTWSFVYYLVVTTITILANGLLIFAMLKDPLKCFLNTTSYFIFHLAFSDLFNSVIFMEESLLWLTKFGGVNGFIPRVFRILNSLVFEVVFFASAASIFSLASERCLGIVFPLWHKVKVTTGVCRMWLAMIWVAGALLVGIRYILLICFEQERAYKVMANLGLGMFVVGTLICYSVCAFTVRKRRLALKQDTAISKATQKLAEVRLRNEDRFLRTMFIIFLGFLLGVIPSMVCLWVLDHVVSIESRNHVIKYTFNVSDMMLLLNYAVNTFIYLWRLPKYRKTFQVLYCRKNRV